jgi:DNA-directed RNA polymerase specialized sigma24 family protein
MPPTLFDHLDREWQHLTASRQGRDALTRWEPTHPVLEGHHSLDNLVRVVNDRARTAVADTILVALARLAPTDTIAARTVLEAVMPGLKRLCKTRQGLAEPEEVTAQIIALAWEQIRTYPIQRRPRRIAANILRDTRQRLDRTQRAWRPLPHPPLPPGDVAEPDAETRNENEPGLVVLDAVRRGHLRLEDARLILQTRVGGIRPEELAEHMGIDVHHLRKRRNRAERRIALASE